MIASEAAEIVAPFIDLQWPMDRRKIFDILELGINKAWSEGRWLGMTVEGFAPTYTQDDGRTYFIAPKSHPILLGININNRPTAIRGKEFQFHRNGNGSMINGNGCSWNSDVYDLGNVPFYNKLNIKFIGGVLIGVRSIGQSGPNEHVYINGTHADGAKIYSYQKRDYGNPCGCKSSQETVETIQGIRLDINQNFNYISDIKFSDIVSISKTITRSPVEIIVIDAEGNGFTIARLEPNERDSKYRKYLVPNSICSHTCIHGMFKISKQNTITNDSEQLIIDNKEALISLAMGIKLMYYKNQLEFGSSMVLQGITILEKEKRETESPNEFPIQIDQDLHRLPETLQYLT